MGVRSKARLNFITPGYSNLTISQINACFLSNDYSAARVKRW